MAIEIKVRFFNRLKPYKDPKNPTKYIKEKLVEVIKIKALEKHQLPAEYLRCWNAIYRKGKRLLLNNKTYLNVGDILTEDAFLDKITTIKYSGKLLRTINETLSEEYKTIII